MRKTNFLSRPRFLRRSVLLAGLLALLTALPAQAVLSAVGPVDPATGFPSYYEDANGVQLKLCVDSDFCLGGNPLPDPEAPASVASGNFPDEAFYHVTRAETDLNSGGRIRWRAVLEGAFANEVVVDGDQVTFTRVQVTGSKINTSIYRAGTVLTFKTPYGNLSAPVNADGKLTRARTESDPGDALNGFAAPVTETGTGYGRRFMRWDPAVAPAAPVGFIGDPLVLHKAIGGRTGNRFRVFRGATAVSPREDEFEIAGQCFDPLTHCP